MKLIDLSNEERHDKHTSKAPLDLTVEKTEDIASLLLSAHQGRRYNIYPSVEQCVEELVKRLTDLVI